MSEIIESISNLGGVGKGVIQSEGSSNVLLPEDAEWVISVMADAERGIGAIKSKREQIQKVIPELRNIKEHEGVYDPKIVSIGPYHHSKPELKEGEKLKAAIAFLFIEDSVYEPQDFYEKTLELVGEARDCYLEGSPFVHDDKAFARMMFLDGCFLLGFIEALSSSGVLHNIATTTIFSIVGPGRISNLLLDIFLLENQLPFLVIQALMSMLYQEGEGEKMIHKFLQLIASQGANKNQERHEEQRQPLHLLELLREKYLSHRKAGDWINKRKDLSSPPKRFKGIDHSFGSAIELKAKGIHFKSTGKSCLTDISFTSSFGYGQLMLPVIVSSHQSRVLFLNMMAYELAPNTPLGFEVCSYIYFMNSLISGADDVIELRSHNIIYNFLDSNEGVAKFFNTMASAALVQNVGILEDVCDQIDNHYTSKTKTWVAQVLHDHFSTPWAALAFLAALLVIFLTFTQAYFQVFPRPMKQK